MVQRPQTSNAANVSESRADSVEGLLREMKVLLEAGPLSSTFLGNLQYEQKGLFKKDHKEFDVLPLRNQILRNPKQLELNLRKDLDANLKKYPTHPELHALHAIQVFKDTNQGGISDKKIGIIKGALKELGVAICNGADSIAILHAFMNMYMLYLDMLKDRVNRVAGQAKNIPNADIITFRKKLLSMGMQLSFLQTAKNKLGGLKRVSEMLGNTNYIFDSISIDELREACKLLLQGQDNSNLKQTNKKASHILYIVFVKAQFFAHIPILRPALISSLKSIPEVHRDLVLQKRMVILIDGINEFKNALFQGKGAEATDGSRKLLAFCQQTISDHLETALITKTFEADPFLKYAWVILESRELFSKDEFSSLLRQAMHYLQIIASNRCHLKNATEQAQSYIFDIQNLQED